MPELPEVETVRRSLTTQLVGRRVVAAAVGRKKLRWSVDAATLRAAVVGRTVLRIDRRAKYLLLHLNAPAAGAAQVLGVHLGMTGWLGVVAAEAPPRPHDHVVLDLAGGDQLRFHDARRFGGLFVVAADALAQQPLLAHLGPEPLNEAAFTGEGLWQACRNVKRSLKAVIMDARCVVGVGNIYASEALFLAGLDPRLPAWRLTRPKAARLVDAIRVVLQEAITLGGTTLRDFASADGLKGMFAPRLRVYGREGADCGVCAGAVRRLVLHGRATYLCASCQRR